MKPIKQTPTRDTYEYGDNHIIVSTDSFCVPGANFPEVKIPYLGCVTSQLNLFWWYFLQMVGQAKNPFISIDTLKMLKKFRKHGFLGQSILMQKLKEVPAEFHVFCYVSESIWKEYQETGNIFGEEFDNLSLYQDLVVPRMYITEKNSLGEDIHLSLEGLSKKLAVPAFATTMVSAATFIYYSAMEYARSRGIIIGNATLKLGFDSENYLSVSDEILTPNTSEMWYFDNETGETKEIFTLSELIKNNSTENGTFPTIPETLIKQTSQEYIEFYERLTGKKFVP